MMRYRDLWRSLCSECAAGQTTDRELPYLLLRIGARHGFGAAQAILDKIEAIQISRHVAQRPSEAPQSIWGGLGDS